MLDYPEAMRTVVRSRDPARLSRFLWEWGVRLANPRFLDMAGMPPADLRSILDDMTREEIETVFTAGTSSIDC